MQRGRESHRKAARQGDRYTPTETEREAEKRKDSKMC